VKYGIRNTAKEDTTTAATRVAVRLAMKGSIVLAGA
jgi:hypothetical protein